jgi:hypothetical protein
MSANAPLKVLQSQPQCVHPGRQNPTHYGRRPLPKAAIDFTPEADIGLMLAGLLAAAPHRRLSPSLRVYKR